MTEEVVAPGPGPGPEEEEPKRKKNGPGPLERPAGRPPATPPGQGFSRAGTNEADLIWNQICEWLPNSNDPALPTRSPFDVTIQVRRTWPPHQSGLAQPIGQGFPGNAVAGSGSVLPGQAIINFVTRYIHLPTTDQPATYDLYFFKKGTGSLMTQGRLPLPSGPECRAMMAAAEQADRLEGMQGVGMGVPGPVPGRAPPALPPPDPPGPFPGVYGAPGWPASPWGPPPWAMAGMGYGAPQQPPPAIDAATLGELSYLRGALSEALSAVKEGRQPMIAPPPGAASPIAPRSSDDELVERITTRVLAGLQRAGIAGLATPQAGGPVGAPSTAIVHQAAAPPSAAAGLTHMAEKALGSLFESTLKTFVGEMERNIKRSMGVGAPLQHDEPEEEPEPVENPVEALPWKSYPVGAQWSNGSPVQFALDKENGGPSLMGMAMTNPFVAEKVVTIVDGLGHAVQDAIRKIGGPGQGPVGAGAMPQAIPAPAPPMPLPPQPPTPPAPPAPQPGSGWGAPR